MLFECQRRRALVISPLSAAVVLALSCSFASAQPGCPAGSQRKGDVCLSNSVIDFIACVRDTTGGKESERSSRDSTRKRDNAVDVELGGTVRLISANGEVKVDGRDAEVIVEESSRTFSPKVVDGCALASHLRGPRPHPSSASATRAVERRGWMAQGRVLDATANPIQNAIVTAEPDAVAHDAGCLTRVRTDQEGKFEFCTRATDDTSITLTLEVTVDDRPSSAPWTFRKGSRQDISVIRSAPEVSTWDAQGQVVDDDGKPLQSATILADVASFPSRAGCTAEVKTNQHGDFHFCTSATDGHSLEINLTVKATGYETVSGFRTFSQGTRLVFRLHRTGSSVPQSKPRADDTPAPVPDAKPRPRPQPMASQHNVPWLLWSGAAGGVMVSAGAYVGARAICPDSRCPSDAAKSGYSALFVTHWIALVGAAVFGIWASIDTFASSGESRAQPALSFSPASLSVEGRF